MKHTIDDIQKVNPEFRLNHNRIGLFNSHFQNFKQFGIPRAQLILTDIPYNIGRDAYGSNPMWYKDGDNKNGESELAGEEFFDTDKDFRPAEFMHFCSQMLRPEPKEKGQAPCMIVFCEFEQQFMLIELARRYGLNNYINLVFRKNYSAQVLKANMKVVGNCEYGLLLYRDKLPKFNNGGAMIFNCFNYPRDTETEKIHPTQKSVPLLRSLIEIFTDPDDVVIDPCVDANTEYFNGMEWVKMSDFEDGDKVLTYDMETGEARLEEPVRFLKQPYSRPFIHYESYSLDIMATPDHNIVNYNTAGRIRKTPFSRVWEDNQNKVLGFRGTVPLTFEVKEDENDYNEYYLRLMVACQADGSAIRNRRTGELLKTNRYHIRVIKERKAQRLRYLLSKAHIEYIEWKERETYKGHSREYYAFSFKSPYGCKFFDKKLLHAKKAYRKIILDELKYWDGNVGKHDTIRYYTTVKHNADFVQLLAHSCDMSARISYDNRTDMTCYTVSFSRKTRAKLSKSFNFGKGMKDNMSQVEVSDKHCYCFQVSTGAFVVRRNGKIHITGNCAGSGSTLIAAASLDRKAYGFEIKKNFYVDACELIRKSVQLDMFNVARSTLKRSEIVQKSFL